MSKGKNFSGNNVGGKRRKSDFYETPYSITQQFLDVITIDREESILEPACGDGAIVRVLKDNGYSVTHYDEEVDFLRETGRYDTVLTNPPFSLAQEFVIKAKGVAKKRICFLLPLSYLHGKKRFDTIYSDKSFALSEVHVFTRYPMLGDPLRDDGKYRTGMMVYAWYVWDRSHVGDPVIRWIDNNSFVIGKGD